MVRDVVYADDDTPVNPTPIQTNLALAAIASQGAYNCYKFKPSKCKVIGADPAIQTEFRIGKEPIKRANRRLLLGAAIDGSGIVAFEHVKSREDMVKRSISQMKSWRTLGLSAGIIFRKLFSAKMLPFFSYAFALLNLPIWGPTHTLIRGVFDKALSNICGWIIPSGVKIGSGLWAVICGSPRFPVFSDKRNC